MATSSPASQTARADDDRCVRRVQPEQPADGLHHTIRPIADARTPPDPGRGQILPDLGGVDLEKLGKLRARYRARLGAVTVPMHVVVVAEETLDL